MKVVVNKLIPFKGFVAINLFGVIFVREECRRYVDRYTLNHEAIHTAQQKELWYVGFYLWYFFEWLYRLVTVKHDRPNAAYYAISFEQEAFKHEHDLECLNVRKRFAWLKDK